MTRRIEYSDSVYMDIMIEDGIEDILTICSSWPTLSAHDLKASGVDIKSSWVTLTITNSRTTTTFAVSFDEFAQIFQHVVNVYDVIVKELEKQ